MASRNVQFYGSMNKALGGDPIQRDYAQDPRRLMAQQLMQQGSSTAPVQSPLEGLTRALSGVAGGYFGGQAQRDMQEREQALSSDISTAMEAATPRVVPATPATYSQSGIGDFEPSTPETTTKGGFAGIVDALRPMDNPDLSNFRQRALMGAMQQQQTLEAAELARTRAIAALKEQRIYNEEREKIKFGRDKLLKLEERKLQIGDNYDKVALAAYFREKQAHDKAYLDVNQIPPPFRPFAPSSASSGQTSLPAQPVIAQPQTINSQTAAPNAPPMSLAEAESLKVLQTAASKKQGENLADAQNELPMIENNSKYLIKALDAVLAPQMDAKGKPVIKDGAFVPGTEHPGLENSIGIKSSGAILDNLPYGVGGPIQGTDAADFTAALKQVTGKQFLQAFETLKGGGQITEIEGTKATEALANLSTSQSEKQFRKALLAFRYEVGELVKIAKKRASTNSQPPPPPGFN